MPELIDRQALLEAYDMAHKGPPGGARKLMQDAPAVNRWIPCSERLPEHSGVYLAYFTFKDGTHATDIAYINTGCCLGSITHWMPLPEPPEKERYHDDVY